MVRYFSLFLFILLALSSRSVAGEQILRYETNLTLETSGELRIVETIDYDFANRPDRHGIFRDIPLEKKINGLTITWDIPAVSVRIDGQRALLNPEIRYNSTVGKYLHLRIGSAGHTVTGVHRYTLLYRCTNPLLPADVPGRDRLHWNAIGDQWAVPIRHAVVHLNLPTPLHQNLVTLRKPVLIPSTAWEDTRHLTLIPPPLSPYHGYDLLLEFPDNLLATNSTATLRHIREQRARATATHARQEASRLMEQHRQENTARHMSLLEWIGFLLLSLLSWRYRDRIGIPRHPAHLVIRYTPPPGLSVLQSALLIDKTADRDDIGAAILELGQLGYLTLKEHARGEEKGIIVRKTDPAHPPSPPLTEDQQSLLNALFAEGEELDLGHMDEARKAELAQRITTLNTSLYDWALTQGYAVNHLKRFRARVFRIAIGVILLVWGLGFFLSSLFPVQHFILLYYGYLLAPALFLVFFDLKLRTKLLIPLAGALLLAGALSLGWIGYPGETPTFYDAFFNPFTPALFVTIFALHAWREAGHLTPKGLETVQWLHGLEHFIRSARENELQRRLEDDPHSLDTLLPYAILFGQVHHWIHLYDITDTPHPTWYTGEISTLASTTFALTQDWQPSSPSPHHTASESGSSSYSAGGYSSGSVSSGGGYGLSLIHI